VTKQSDPKGHSEGTEGISAEEIASPTARNDTPCRIAALPLVARNDDHGAGGLTSGFYAHERTIGACGISRVGKYRTRTYWTTHY
jgi:hypothetical protein